MAWDDDKSTASDPDNPTADEQVTADEWNTHVVDQKNHAARHEQGGSDVLSLVVDQIQNFGSEVASAITGADISPNSVDANTVNTEDAQTSRDFGRDYSENLPHINKAPETVGPPLYQDSPHHNNPVVDASQVTDLANARFVADPFIQDVDGTIHLFAEVKHDDDGDGNESQSISHWSGPTLNSLSYNAEVIDGESVGEAFSYPWFAKVEGTWYLVPYRTGLDGQGIWTIDNFPPSGTADLTKQTTILQNTFEFGVQDFQPVYHNDRWFAFGMDEAESNLDWFYADSKGRDQLTGSWSVGGTVFSQGDELQTPAGNIVKRGEKFLFPVENQTDISVRMFAVSEMTTNSVTVGEFATSPVLQGDDSESTWKSSGMHHMSITAGGPATQPTIVADGKDSSSNWSVGSVLPTSSRSALASLTKTSVQTGIGTNTRITWGSAQPDFESAFNDSNNSYDAPTDGWYRFELSLAVGSQSAGDLRIIKPEIDDTQPDDVESRTIAPAAGGDYIEFDATVYMSSGESLTLTYNTDGSHDISTVDSKWDIFRHPDK